MMHSTTVKHATTLLLWASTTAALAQPADWVREAPFPFPMQTSGEMAFLNSQRGYMVGLGATALMTDDGGRSWDVAPVPGDDYTCVFALDDQHVWMFGNTGARSTDGGQTWDDLGVHTAWETKFLNTQFGWTSDNYVAQVTHDGGATWSLAQNGSNRIIYPDFITPQLGLGILESFDSALWRTTNGGQTWSEVSPINATSVAFMSESVALAVGGGRIYRSADGGATWSDVAAGHTPYPSIVVFDANTAIVNAQNAYSQTHDGGVTWTRLSAPPGNLRHVFVRDGLDAFGVTNSAAVLHSTDGFLTWQETAPATHIGLSDMEFLSDGGIVASGTDVIQRSEDGGHTWNATNSGVMKTVVDVDMFDSQRGLALADGGIVLRTNDSGNQWIPSRPSYVQGYGWNYCTDLFILNDHTAYVSGDDGPGPLIKTTDGGETWQPIGYPTTSGTQSIWFVDEMHGWIGRGYTTGWIYRTADGGATWQEVWPQSFGGIWDIQFHDLNLGWALRGGHYIMRTIDGGNNWTEALLPGGTTCVKFQFINQNVGYAVGDFGAVCKSIDGGRSWQLLDAGTGEHLQDVRVISEQELYITGANNTLRHSTDGGRGWTDMHVIGLELPQYQAWYAIDRLEDGTMRLAGSNGFILRQPGESRLPLDLSVDNLVGGADAVFTITHATPNRNQYIVYSLRGLGSTFVPQLNVTLGLRQPVLLTSGRADANGNFTSSVHVPSGATGRTVWFQGAELDRVTAVVTEVVR